ncbi:hypothetical protein AOLI_G00111340 [Acnodon oligacanthus]
MPFLIASAFHSGGVTYNSLNKRGRFNAVREKSSFNLSISNAEPSDSATYYCAVAYYTSIALSDCTVLVLKGSTSLSAVLQPPVSDPVELGGDTTLQCSILTDASAGEHSVYWFRHGSGESHPGIIYTHGNRSDECEKSSETDSPTQSCVYKLPKRNLSLSDAGTYYCAVLMCGEIIFGSGTKLDFAGNSVLVPVILGFAALNITSMIVVLILCRKLHNRHHKEGAAEGHTVQVNQGECDEALNYAALSFTNKPPSSRGTRRQQKLKDTESDACVSNNYFCPIKTGLHYLKSLGMIRLTVLLLTAFGSTSKVDISCLNGLKVIQDGENITLTCASSYSYVRAFAWFKQTPGEKALLIASDFGFTPQYHNDFDKSGHFIAVRGQSSFTLSISKTEPSDSATYYCSVTLYADVALLGCTVLVLKGSSSSLSAVLQPPVSDPVELGGDTTLQCSILTDASAGEHSVYWFRHGSGESHPGIIYTHGNRSDECEKSSETDSPTQSCVYKLPKRNLSPSDAGTYYCAVLMCGEIIFGNGTKIDFVENGVMDPALIGLAASNIISMVVVLFLCRKLYSSHHKNAAEGHTVQANQAEDTDVLNYAALSFAQSSSSRRSRTKNSSDQPVYAQSGRFIAVRGQSSFTLSISKTEPSDSATYYCSVTLYPDVALLGCTVLVLKGSSTSLSAVLQPPVSDAVELGGDTTLQCSILTDASAGDHSVYWFRHGSGESHPGIIYTHGNRSDECEKSSETDSPTQSCVYKLPKRNLSLSDAGTHYCAVLMCGEIIFGNGTKVDIPEKGVLDPVLLVLAASNITSLVLALFLCRKLHKHHHKDAAEDPSLHVNQAEDTDVLNYAALSFAQSSSSRRSRTKNSSDQPVYAQVMPSNCPAALEHSLKRQVVLLTWAAMHSLEHQMCSLELPAVRRCQAIAANLASQSSSSTTFMPFPGAPPHPMNLVQERNNGAQ